MKRRVLLAALLAFTAGSARDLSAQTLADRIAQLIRFGNCEQALCLVTGGGSHGAHYIDAAQAASGDLVNFLTSSITTSVSRLPISSTSGGVTFSFVGGAPVRSTTSAGPIFAERASTLGKGRILAGVNLTNMAFKKLRGISTDSIDINLAHQDVGNPGLGDPGFENDVIGINLNMQVDLMVTSLFATYGLTDRIDVSVAVPFVMASLTGSGRGEVFNPSGTVSGVHFFGTAGAPDLTASTEADGSASGIGDIAVRAKVKLTGSSDGGLLFLADVRLPTGDETNFHGSGNMSATGQLVASTKRGNFAPHANVGYALRTGDDQNSAIVATFGFDHMISRPFTLAVDLLSEVQVGDKGGNLPEAIALSIGEVRGTNIPDEKDSPINLSVGGRFLVGDFTVVANGLLPVKKGGLQPKFAWTLGIERVF